MSETTATHAAKLTLGAIEVYKVTNDETVESISAEELQEYLSATASRPLQISVYHDEPTKERIDIVLHHADDPLSMMTAANVVREQLVELVKTLENEYELQRIGELDPNPNDEDQILAEKILNMALNARNAPAVFLDLTTKYPYLRVVLRHFIYFGLMSMQKEMSSVIQLMSDTNLYLLQLVSKLNKMGPLAQEINIMSTQIYFALKAESLEAEKFKEIADKIATIHNDMVEFINGPITKEYEEKVRGIKKWAEQKHENK